MPINEQGIFWNWNSPNPKDHEILARCVQEGLAEIARITKEAEQVLKDGTGDSRFAGTGDPSFDGHISGPARVRDQVQALFYYLQDCKPKIGKGLSYICEPWDSTLTRQRLRLVREVLHYGQGTCIDWVSLLDSCLAHVRLNPLVIITEAPPLKKDESSQRHAILGYWLQERMRPKPVMMGEEFVQFLQKHGDSKLFGVVNATRIPPDESGQKKRFEGEEGAEWEAITWLPNDVRPFVIGPVQQIAPAYSAQKILLVVDIRAAREAGIKPLLPLEPWSDNHPLPRAEHFQERPELEDVRKWWRNENSYGVLALVGIGGAGKTAVVQRFLAQLPGSHVQEEEVEKDRTLPIPDALFVWSFYQHPDVDRCATALYNYLTDEQVSKATFEQVQEALSKNWRGCRALLVFDGVEKLQIAPGIEPEEEGGTFGQFLPEGAPLARFLRWCCDGPRPAHVLITSRFPLTDLRRYESAGSYCVVDAGDLPLESAHALLRAHGVKGLDLQLDDLIREFGNHAQTLDLLGNALRIWCDGDPSQISKLPSLEDVKRLPGIRDKVWGRVRVLRFYEKKLPQEALRILQLLCTFQIIPVDIQLLAKVFLSEFGQPQGVLSLLSKLSAQDLEGHLISLECEYSLVHSAVLKTGPKTYTVYPAVRTYFYDRLPNEERDSLHERVVGYLTSLPPILSLLKRIANIREEPLYFPPIAHEHSDTLEELIHHTLCLGRVEPCWVLYTLGLGKYDRLGKQLGLFSRGERIARLFADKLTETSTVDAPGLLNLKADILNERGVFLQSLGSLKLAADLYRTAAHILVEIGDLRNASTSYVNLCETLALAGHLCAAFVAGQQALDAALGPHPEEGLDAVIPTQERARMKGYLMFTNRPAREELKRASAYLGHILALQGEVSVSESRFREALGYQLLQMQEPVQLVVRSIMEALGGISLISGGVLLSLSGVFHASLLMRTGRLNESSAIVEENRRVFEKAGIYRDLARFDCLYAELAHSQGKVSEARDVLTRAIGWGVQKADQEVLVWSNLISAHLALDTGDLSEAEKALREGLRIAEYCGYGLYWIDLQVAKGQWELACGRQSQAGKGLPPELENWTPQQWFERAEASALRALNGQLKESDDPATRPNLPEDQLAMLGARHPECGYAWGEGDALHLLGEALLALAQYVGPGGHDTKGRSYAQLLEKARQATEEALALRQRIQDPKAKETEDLLARLEREHETG